MNVHMQGINPFYMNCRSKKNFTKYYHNELKNHFANIQLYSYP